MAQIYTEKHSETQQQHNSDDTTLKLLCESK